MALLFYFAHSFQLAKHSLRESILSAQVSVGQRIDSHATTGERMDDPIIACIQSHVRDASLVGVAEEDQIAIAQIALGYVASTGGLCSGCARQVDTVEPVDIASETRAIEVARAGGAKDVPPSQIPSGGQIEPIAGTGACGFRRTLQWQTGNSSGNSDD